MQPVSKVHLYRLYSGRFLWTEWRKTRLPESGFFFSLCCLPGSLVPWYGSALHSYLSSVWLASVAYAFIHWHVFDLCAHFGCSHLCEHLCMSACFLGVEFWATWWLFAWDLEAIKPFPKQLHHFFFTPSSKAIMFQSDTYPQCLSQSALS